MLYNYFILNNILYEIVFFKKIQNMFIAIINDAYIIVKEDMKDEKDDFAVDDYIRRGANNMLVKNYSKQISRR